MRRRDRIVLAGLLTLCGLLGGVAWTFTPATLATGRTAVSELPQADPPAGLQLIPIINGTLLSRAAFAFRGGAFGEDRRFAIGGLLIRHPAGTLLVDAGFGARLDEHIGMLPAMMQRATRHEQHSHMAAALSELGLEPDAVLLTHAHWDHVSGLEELPGLPVLLPAEELAFVERGGDKTSLARRIASDRLETLTFSEGAYLGFPASHDHFGDGSVVVVPAPGHTPGSVIVFVALPSGQRLALIGDIAWQLEGVRRPAERPWLLRLMVDEEPARVRELLIHLHELADAHPDLRLVPAHDERAWAEVGELAGLLADAAR